MMDNSHTQRHSGDSRRLVPKSAPRLSVPETGQRASKGRRLIGALTRGSNRGLPSLRSPSGGAAATSLLVQKRFTYPLLALLALLAVGLVALLPGGPLQAQESSTIEYAENGTGPVAVFTATDPEMAGAITWSLMADAGDAEDDEDLEIDKSSGELTFKKSPDYEDPKGGGASGTSNIYTVTVVATDADRVTSPKTVTIEVTNVDEAGKVTLDKVAPYPAILLTAALADPDKGESGIKWQWSRSMSENGPFADIEDEEAIAYMPTSGDVGYYLRATVSYKDGEGSGKSAIGTSAHVVQAINVPNATPTFPDDDEDDTNGNQTTREVGENADAGASVGAPVEAADKDSDILTYTVASNDGTSFVVDPATGQISVGPETKLNFEDDEEYVVTVTATDPAGTSATIDVTIDVVDDENEAPEITGTVPPSFNEGTNAAPLTGQSLLVVDFTATDPDPDNTDNLGISWSLGGSDAGDFTIVNGDLTFRSSPNYEAPADADRDNVYEVSVAASDADSNRREMSVKVKVANVEEPGTVTLSAVQPRVGVSLTARVTDIDGGVSDVKWQWSKANGDIDGATSDKYTPVGAVDGTDVGGTLTATASYNDAEGPVKMAFANSANDVAADTRNKAPEFGDQDDDLDGTQNSEAERTIAENSPATTPVSGGVIVAVDPNEGDQLTYTLGGPDASSFGIGSVNETEGQITVGAGTKLDFETKATYMVTVIATDSYGESASIDVTIKVTDENEGPAITGPAEAEYLENGTGPVAAFTAVDPEMAGAITWSLKADEVDVDQDNEDFEIDKSSGELSFTKSPNYEMGSGGGEEGASSTYTVTVVAADADNMMNEKAVTIEVPNVDEAGKVTLDKVAPYPGVALTAMLTDPDMAVGGSEKWQWSRSSSKNGSYNDIADLAKVAAYSPTSGDVGYYLRATVSYNDGEGDAKGAMLTSTHRVQTINSPDRAPAFLDEDPDTTGVQNDEATRMVGENADEGANVGAPLAAADEDSDILTYTLGGNDASSFEIDQATGQITVGADTELNFEPSGTTYQVMVTATDPSGVNPATIAVTIEVVDDANEPPAIDGTVPVSLNEGTAADPLTGQALRVVDFEATDPDPDNANTDITWSLSGPDAGDFTIEGGDLTFKASPNYERPGDADGDNEYEVTVAASDADSNRGERSVKFKVANVDEPGTVTLSAVQARVGVPLTARLTDIDGAVSGVMWRWSNGGDIDDARSDTYTPAAGNANNTLTVTATYTDLEGPDKTATITSTAVAEDTRNKAPVFDDQDGETEGTQNTEAERTVAESPTASTVGDAVSAEDANTGDVVSYTLGGPDASSFTIGLTTGQITVGAGTKLDFETKPIYMVTVIATDSFGLKATIPVTIKVTDQNEGPEISVVEGLAISGLGRVNYEENETGAVATYTAAGEGAASATWDLSGDDADAFEISSGGELTFAASPDFEAPTDADEDNDYEVTVTATAGTNTATQDVTVTVTDVEEVVVEGSLMQRYDADKDGTISKVEVLVAIDDYLFEFTLTKDEVVEVIDLYLFPS